MTWPFLPTTRIAVETGSVFLREHPALEATLADDLP